MNIIFRKHMYSMLTRSICLHYKMIYGTIMHIFSVDWKIVKTEYRTLHIASGAREKNLKYHVTSVASKEN